MCLFEKCEANINHTYKAQSNGTFSAFSWSDEGKEAFTNRLELASIGQIFWKVLKMMLL